MAFENRNTVVFDELAFDERVRSLLSELLVGEECYSIFNTDIELKPLDSYVTPDSYFPCVTVAVFNQGADVYTSDSMQIQNRTKFTLEINTYTIGETKRKDNIRLAKLIEQKLQSVLGLSFLQNQEINSEVSTVSRRQLRATNIIDNVSNIIYDY